MYPGGFESSCLSARYGNACKTWSFLDSDFTVFADFVLVVVLGIKTHSNGYIHVFGSSVCWAAKQTIILHERRQSLLHWKYHRNHLLKVYWQEWNKEYTCSSLSYNFSFGWLKISLKVAKTWPLSTAILCLPVGVSAVMNKAECVSKKYETSHGPTFLCSSLVRSKLNRGSKFEAPKHVIFCMNINRNHCYIN